MMLALLLLLAPPPDDGNLAGEMLREAITLAREKRLDEAERVLLAGRSRFPHDAGFLVELAGIAWLRQNPAAAQRQLRRALKLDPHQRYATDFLGTLYLLDGNLPAALKYWNRIGKPLIQNLSFKPALALKPVLRDRAFLVSPGQVFTRDRLAATQANLSRLQIPSTYRFDLAARDDERFDLTFRSMPTVTAAGILGGWVGRLLPLLRGLPYETLFLDWRNIGGSGTYVASLWRWDSNQRRARIELGSPIRLDPRHLLRVTLDARDERWLAGFTMRRYEAGFGIETAVTGHVSWTSGFAVARRTFRDAPGADPGFAGGWSYSFPNRFDWTLPGWPGHRISLSAEAMVRPGRVEGPDASRFLVSAAGLRSEWRPGRRDDLYRLTTRLRGGYTLGRIAFDEFFELGTDRDNDLWMRGHAGIRDGRKGAAPLGTRYSLAQIDAARTLLRHPLMRLEAGPFFDTGRIGGAGAWGSRGWLFDAGMQMRVRTLGGINVTLLYGRDLRGGRGLFFADASR